MGYRNPPGRPIVSDPDYINSLYPVGGTMRRGHSGMPGFSPGPRPIVFGFEDSTNREIWD
jgi:hypothetical protein